MRNKAGTSLIPFGKDKQIKGCIYVKHPQLLIHQRIPK